MFKEVEIKLRATAETLQAVKQSSFIEGYRCSDWQERSLDNQYFDTPCFRLADARVALRIRKDAEQFIQTLKTKGSSVAGLSERNEWDWTIEAAQLDLSLLTDACWPQSLQDLDKQQLQCIFHTDFTRQLVELCWEHEGKAVRVEVALDQGQVRTNDGRSESISEIELELREGEPEALLQLAQELARQFPLMPCDISKAERGYRLLHPASFDLQLPMQGLTAETAMDSAIEELAWQLLSGSQRLAEQYRYSKNWKLLQQWIYSLIQLRALLTGAGQIIPRKTSHALRQQLDALLGDWLKFIDAGDNQELRQQAESTFAAELQLERWGVFSLSLALWLHQKGWQQARNERAQRQAQAELARWLTRTLREDLQHLRDSGYADHPERLTEQLQRLERIVFWLEHARQVLELEQKDDLLGSLRHVLVAARTENEEALRQYSLGLWQNPACKQLMTKG